MSKHTLRTPNGRRSIPTGTKLHIAPQPTPGLAVGYRKSETLGGIWFARKHREGTTKYTFHRIGAADDSNEANNTTFYSYEQAVKAAEQWFQHETGAILIKKSYTLADLMPEYLQDRKINGCKSLHKTQRTIETHILSKLGDVPLRKLTHGQVKQWFDNLACGRSTTTANRIWNVLRAMLNFAYREHKVANDHSWDKIKSFKAANKAEIVALTKDEAKALMENCPADFLPLVQAALLTGCRYGELCALKVKHFKFDTEQLHIEESKTGYERYIPLNRYGITLFQRLTQDRQPNEPIFLKDGKREWRGSEQQRPMIAAVTTAGISKHIGFHCLRHSYACWCLQNGMRMEEVASLLGHRDIRITQKHYAQFSPSHLQAKVRAYAPQFSLETAHSDLAGVSLSSAPQSLPAAL